MERMFKINLTSLILMVALIWVLIFSINKCSSARDYRKAFEIEVESGANMTNTLIETFNQERKVFRDSIEFFRELAHGHLNQVKFYKGQVGKLKRDLSDIEAEVKQMPYDSSYVFLTGLYRPLDTLQFPFSGNQVGELHIDYLEGEKCKEISEGLELENKYFNLSLIASGEMNVQMEKELEACDKAMDELGKQIRLDALEKKTLKKKVWTNRILAGVAGILMVLVAL